MAAQLDQPAAVRTPDKDGLVAWAARTGHHRAVVPGGGGLRFAFYGRGVDGGLAGSGDVAARQLGQAGVCRSNTRLSGRPGLSPAGLTR